MKILSSIARVADKELYYRERWNLEFTVQSSKAIKTAIVPLKNSMILVVVNAWLPISFWAPVSKPDDGAFAM
jgi:hypothetical protein